MIKITATACIERSVDESWQVLSDVENISKWSEVVLTAQITSKNTHGVGLERVCQLKNNVVITEKWVDWEDGHSFTYEGFNLPLVKSAKNKWTVIDEAGKTLLKTQSEVVMKGGVFGKVLEPLMRVMANRMGADSLAAFKYLAENGHEYEGKHTKLQRAPIAC